LLALSVCPHGRFIGPSLTAASRDELRLAKQIGQRHSRLPGSGSRSIARLGEISLGDTHTRKSQID
jgi:hypothetical protein